MSKDTAGQKGTPKRNSSGGSEATRNILQDVCLDFESIDVAPKSNKIGVIKNVKKPNIRQQENSGTSSFKVTYASSQQENSGTSSFKVTDASSQQKISGTSSFKVTDASSQQENSGTSSFKVTDESSQQENSGNSSFKVTDVSEQENSGNSSFKVTDASEPKNSGTSSFKVTDASSQQGNSGHSSFKVRDVSQEENSGNSSFKVTDASSDSIVNNQINNNVILTVRNEGQLRTGTQNDFGSSSIEASVEPVQDSDRTDVVNAESNIPTSSTFVPTTAASNLTILPEDLAVAKSLSSLAQLADAEIVQSGDNVSIIVTNPRLIKVLTDASASMTELQAAAVIESPQLSADDQVGIVDPNILPGDVFEELDMMENSVMMEEEVVSESSSSRSGTDRKTPKRIFSNSGRFPKRPLSAQPCYAPSTPASRARRVTTRMKAAWARLLELDGHLVCQMPGCSQTFVTVANFTTHYKFCSGKKTLKKCDYCASMIFSTAKATLQHMEVEHPDSFEEYKAAHPELLIELERSDSPSHLLISEDENVAMNLEEVTHQPSKSSRKRKLSPKENIVPRKKVILKHKLQSIQNSMAENAKEFKKCVRFDAIADTINAVEEACNFETPTHSDEPRRMKKKRHIFTERIVAEKKYFEDDEDVDAPPMTEDELLLEEKLSLRERNHTKARMLLNLDRYKRYQEYLTVTRDWSSERRTYSRSRCSDASAEQSFENSFLAQLHNECFEDPNQLNNAGESSAISMPTPEAEITAIQLNPAETYRVLDTEQFVSVIPVPSEPPMNEISAAMSITNMQPRNRHDALQSTPNLPEYPLSLFSPYEKTSEIRIKREKTACYNRVSFESPKPKPKLGIITYGLAVPNEEINKPVEPPITFDSLVNSMIPISASQNSEAGADQTVIAHADVNKSAKECATENSPQVKRRGRPPKIKTEPIDVKGGKTLKNKALQNNSGKKYSAAMLKTIEANIKSKKIKLFGVKKNSKLKSKKYGKESRMQGKNLKAKNIVMKKTKRNMLAKKIINKTKKPRKTKSVDNSTILCQENIDNHLPLNQGVDNISGIPCLTADHNYIQPGITDANSILEVQPAVNANNVSEDIEVSTSNAENILQSVSDEVEKSSENIQTEKIDSTAEAVKQSVVPDSLNNSAEVAHSLPVDDGATKEDFPESVDGNAQNEQTVSVIQAVKDVEAPDSLNSSAEVAHSISTDNDAAKKDYPQSVDSVQNLTQVEKMDTCINSTNQADKSSVDDASVRSTEKDSQINEESVKSLPETIQNNQDSALDTTLTPEITVDKTLDQNSHSLAAQEKQSEKIVTEHLKEPQNASSEAPDLSADKYIQSNLMEKDSSMTELSAPTLERENESSQAASTKSVEEQSVTNEKESSASSQNIETPLPEVPVKRGRGRPRKSTNKTSPTVSDQNTDKAPPTISDHDELKKDKTDKSLVITDSNDSQTDANKSTNEKLDVDNNDSTPVRKSQRIKKRKVMGDEIFERPLAVSKQKEKVTPKQKGEVITKKKGEVICKTEDEVTPKQKEKVTPKQKGEVILELKEEVIPEQKEKVTPKQKGKVTPKQKGEVTPSTPASQSKRRGRPRKYPAKDSPSELLSPVDNVNEEVQKLVKIEPEPADENLRKYSRKGRPRKCVRYADLNSGVDSSESLDESSSPNAGKDKSDLKGKNAKGVDKSGNVEEDVKGIIESVNEQEEEIVLPLKKRKQRQSKKNDDGEVEILESSSHIPENADQFTVGEKKSEQDDDVVEENSVNTRQRRKRKRTGSSDEEWDPSVHLKNKQASRSSHQKSQSDVAEIGESSEDSDIESFDRSISRLKKTEPRKGGPVPRGIPSSKLSNGLLLKYSLQTFGEALTDYKPLKSLWKLFSNEEYILPPFKTSAYFKIEKTWDESPAYWQSLDLFDSVPLDKDSCHGTFFTGGPATCSAWCPVPVDANDVQYVALAVSYGVDKVHSYAFDETERGLIQLWNVGDLRRKRLEQTPLMELSIFHEFAPINDMKWCPYGGWEKPDSDLSGDVLPRLGLLAVACADSCVRIYSIPHPNYLPKQGTCYPIYSANPSILLEPMHGDICNVTKKSMCISLAWQKSDGCERIAAGYGSGMICVWRLNSLATILTSKDNNQTILSPYLIFIGHGTPVLGLSFAPLPGGRYLVSSSIDKTLKFWDLLDTSIPFYIVKKGAGKSVEWSNIYCGAFGTMELGLNNYKASVFFKECGTENFIARMLCNHSCHALTTAFSEWLNANAIVDIAGSVSVSMSYVSNMIQEHPKTPSYFHRHLYQSELKPVEGIHEKIAFSSHLDNADCVSTLQLMSDVAAVVNKLIQMVLGISPDSHPESQVAEENSQNVSKGLTDDQFRELSGNVNSLMTIEQMKEVISVVHDLTENCGSEVKSISDKSHAKDETTKETVVEVPSNDSSDSNKEEDCKAQEKEHASEVQSSVSSKLSEITDIVTLVTDIKDVTDTVEEVASDSSIGSDDLVMDLDEEPVQDSSILPVGESKIEPEVTDYVLESIKDTVLIPSDIADIINSIDFIEKNGAAMESQVSFEQEVQGNTIPDVQSDGITCVSVVDEMTDVVTAIKEVSEKCVAKDLLDVDAKQVSEITLGQNDIEKTVFTNLTITELTNKLDEELIFSDTKIIESVLQKIKDVISTADEIVEETCELINFDIMNNYTEMLLINISPDSVEEPSDHNNVADNKEIVSNETEFNYSQTEISDIVSSVVDMKETFEVIEAIKDTAEVLLDINDTATVVSDIKDTTEILLDINVTTEVISDINDTAEVVSDMNDTIAVVADMRDIVDVVSDINQTTEVLSDMKEIVSSVEDMKEFNFVIETINCACIEDQLLLDASAVVDDIIKRVSHEMDEESAVQSLLHKMVSNIQMLCEVETETSSVSDISKNKTIEGHLSSSDPSEELSSIPPGENEKNCDLSVPNMKVFDSCEMDEQMLSSDSESSNSENEMDSDGEMEVDNSYLFDQDSNLSDDSILSECSLASAVSICSFSSESDVSDDSCMSFHDDLVIDETVPNSQNVSSEAVTLPSESSPNPSNLTSEPSCDLPSKTIEMDVCNPDDFNTKPESESLVSTVLDSQSSEVSFVENSLEETVITLESDGAVPDSQNTQPEEKLVSDEADNTDTLSCSAIPNSEISDEASEKPVSETLDSVNDASAEKTEVITLTDEASSNKSCDMNYSKESDEIIVEFVQETFTDSVEKSMDCSETLNSSGSLLESNSSDTVLPEMPDIILDSSDTTENVKNSEPESARTAVTKPTVDSAKKTTPSKKISCYENVISQYGIVFKDMDSANFHNIENKNFEEFSEDSLNPCHLTHVKTVSWNPNFGSHFWLFSAGQSGIARLSYVSNANHHVDRSRKKKK